MTPTDHTKTIADNLRRVDELVEGSLRICGEGYPLFSWIEISPTDLCNRKCEFCPRPETDRSAARPVMAKALYEKMALELEETGYGGTVMLAGYGEPLLSDNIVDMTRTFARVCNTEITTNGDPLTPRLIGELMNAGAARLILSLYDGPHQIEKFSVMFSEAGAPPEFYVLRDRWYSAEKDFGLKLTNRAGTVSAGNQPSVDQGRACYYPHYMMMVDWDGSVYLCTQDWNRREACGSLATSSLLEVWTSSVFRKYRNLLADGKRVIPPCAGCNADGKIHGENHARAWGMFYGKEAENES